jgi:hypothetical protein
MTHGSNNIGRLLRSTGSSWITLVWIRSFLHKQKPSDSCNSSSSLGQTPQSGYSSKRSQLKGLHAEHGRIAKDFACIFSIEELTEALRNSIGLPPYSSHHKSLYPQSKPYLLIIYASHRQMEICIETALNISKTRAPSKFILLLIIIIVNIDIAR